MTVSFMGEWIRVTWDDRAGTHHKAMKVADFDAWYHAHKPVVRMVVEGLVKHGS